MDSDSGHFPVWRDGATPFYTCSAANGVSYCAYVPRGGRARHWLVAVHGSGRGAESLRDALAGFAEETGIAVLAPLFPIGLDVPDDEPSYKFVRWNGRSHDRSLHALLEDAETRFGIPAARFQMFGFSGGAQFVQRYVLFHPDRVIAASIGAPGYVTILDEDLDWWPGMRNFETVAGHPLDREALARIPVQIIVGRGDLDETFMVIPPDSLLWAPGADRCGRNRVERAHALAENLKSNGVSVDLVVAEESRHALTAPIFEPAMLFLRRTSPPGSRDA